MKIGLIVIASICFALWGFKKIKNMTTKTYNWEPTTNAPILFPVDIHIAYMRYGEKSAVAVASSDNTGLGVIGSWYGLEGGFPLPTGLDVIWLSLVEKKFYGAEIDFPMERVAELFDNGYINYKGEKETYRYVNACFLPGGRIVVYLNGGPQTVILGEFQGIETTVEMKDFIPDGYYSYKNWDEYFEAIFDSEGAWAVNYFANGIPWGLWDRYFERFNYDVKFEFENNESEYNAIGYKFVNGEGCIMETTYIPEMAITPTARVHTIDIDWTVGKYLYSAWFYFNEAEVLELFDKAFEQDRNAKGELRVWVSKYNNLFEISLLVNGKEYKFEKTQIRVFKEIKNQRDTDELIYKNYEGGHASFIGE